MRRTHLGGKYKTPRGTKVKIHFTLCGQVLKPEYHVKENPSCEVCKAIKKREWGFLDDSFYDRHWR